MTKQFAVIGNPIEQSRSPELHHAFAQKTGVDLDYQKRLAPLDGFEPSMRSFFENGGSGMNVTVPFKEQAFALCDVLTERAQIAKAVNTLWMEDGKLHGDNTDGQGLVAAIQALDWNLENTAILERAPASLAIDFISTISLATSGASIANNFSMNLG